MPWRYCLKKSAIKIVRAYQLIIAPHLPKVCRFEPTCSQYCILSIEKNGLAKGLLKSVKRILRCNPFYRGGIDLP
ncbi:MAG: membrane protein insertion efficiency factor YidD [Patescibacteria group bacterium]